MFEGEYEPSKWDWVANQIEEYEASGGTKANTLRDTGIPIIVFTTVGHKTGKLRKVALMRVEHEGRYALIASKGGAPADPGWVHNLDANSTIWFQDGPAPFETTVRRLEGEERSLWWDRGVAVFPNYAEYQAKTEREIPVYLTEPQS